jgi:predicted Fe-S protein YdhL (DUF1289 family)
VAEAGKGSRQRPIQDMEQFNQNWDAIFGSAESPCVEICELDFLTQQCRGCHRTLQEIADWSRMSGIEKRRTIKNAKERGRHEKSLNA